jgi:hypothetical protein
MRNPDMTGKPKHFFSDRIFKSDRKSDRKNHGHNTDGRCRRGETNDKPGKGMLTVESYALCNKPGKVQSGKFNTQK